MPNSAKLQPRASDSWKRENNTVEDANNVASNLLMLTNLNTPNIQPSKETKSQRQPTTSPQEYVVEQIVQHIGKQSNVRCIVFWYGSDTFDDIVEPPKNPQRTLSRDVGTQEAMDLIDWGLYFIPAVRGLQLKLGEKSYGDRKSFSVQKKENKRKRHFLK